MPCVPGERVPLHIFEHRYQRMIADCIEHDAAFGIVFRDDDGARAIGCTALVAEVIERFDDGRLDIVVTGDGAVPRARPLRGATSGRPRDVEMIDGRGAEPTPTAEAAEPPARPSPSCSSGRQPSGPRRGSPAAAYAIAAQIEMPGDDKQGCSRRRDEGERLRMLGGALRQLLAAPRSAPTRSPSAPRRTATAPARSRDRRPARARRPRRRRRGAGRRRR